MRSALPYGFLAMQVNVPLSGLTVSVMCSSDKYPPFTEVPFTSYLQTKHTTYQLCVAKIKMTICFGKSRSNNC
jgi:hypothetical protein